MLEASRELDVLVAEKVMGRPKPTEPPLDDDGWHECYSADQIWIWHPGNNLKPGTGWWLDAPYPRYSTDIAAAWQVVEIFRRSQGGHAAAQIEMTVSEETSAPDCQCVISGPDIPTSIGYGQEMPRAICLAALKAVGVQT